MMDYVIRNRRLLGTDVDIGHQSTDEEQQDKSKAEGKFVGDFQISKPAQHSFSL